MIEEECLRLHGAELRTFAGGSLLFSREEVVGYYFQIVKDLQERLEESIRQAETSTFDGIITLITGEKIESEFFHRLSDDVFVDRKNKTEFIRDKIVSVKYIEDRRTISKNKLL
ncbi:hypothetical protein ACNFU2_19860 [Chryseobacterium sp. PTM-20240506]|uniref:hypothetical protein n=1 Tax=Chryseobacterium sp. PTM-20240506 TaxID=3400631 RepID=UPI0027A3D39D|nr:hypothetical protein PFY10_19235 [Chryseobacterium daecheongense]